MASLHELHPAAQKLGWIEQTMTEAHGSLRKTAGAIAAVLRSGPTAVLVGAGMSRSAGLPTAPQFCEELVRALMGQPPVAKLLADHPGAREEWEAHLSHIEFDALLALVRIADPTRHPHLFDAFLNADVTEEYALLLQIAQATRIRTILTTNFDAAVERTAEHLGVPLRSVAQTAEFPDSPQVQEPIALFKLHGGVRSPGIHEEIMADFERIGGELNGPRMQLLRRCRQSHHLLVLGYGGQDYWDIYPVLFEQGGALGMVWVDHADTERPQIATASECYALLRIRDPVERLLAFSPGRVRVRVHTTQLLRALAAELECPLEPLAIGHRRGDNWKGPVHTWACDRGRGALVDFATILAACGELRLAHEGFARALSWRSGALSDGERIEALLGRARSTNRPDMADLRAAMRIAKRAGDPVLHVRAIVETGIALGNTGARGEAAEMFAEGVDLANADGLPSAAGLCLANKAHQFSCMGEFQKAHEVYTDAEAALRSGGDIPDLVVTLQNHSQMLVFQVSQPWAILKALELDLEALARSWGRRFDRPAKLMAGARVLAALSLVHPNPSDAIDYLVRDPLLNQSGVAEHFIHWIIENGYSTSGLQLEGWQHEMRLT